MNADRRAAYQAELDENARTQIGDLLQPGEEVLVSAATLRMPSFWLFGLLGAGAAFMMRSYLLILTQRRLFVIPTNLRGRGQPPEAIADRSSIRNLRVTGMLNKKARFSLDERSYAFMVTRVPGCRRLFAELGAPVGA